MTGADPLEVYLSDHLAGSDAAIAMIDRWKQQASDPAVRGFFLNLGAEIVADQRALEAVRGRLGPESTIKRAGGWIAEKFTRLKLPSSDAGRESFSLFESLELLAIGVFGKRTLWAMLARLADVDPRLHGIDFVLLEDRAVEQHAIIEHERLAVGLRALAPETDQLPQI